MSRLGFDPSHGHRQGKACRSSPKMQDSALRALIGLSVLREPRVSRPSSRLLWRLAVRASRGLTRFRKFCRPPTDPAIATLHGVATRQPSSLGRGDRRPAPRVNLTSAATARLESTRCSRCSCYPGSTHKPQMRPALRRIVSCAVIHQTSSNPPMSKSSAPPSLASAKSVWAFAKVPSAAASAPTTSVSLRND